MKKTILTCLFGALAMSALAPADAHAFCGFFVSGGDQPLYNNATQVVLMRDGTTTVLSMRNNYKGPTEDFAMVIPVPQVLQEENVKTLEDKVFDRVNKFSAPRLVEYFEQDPCFRPRPRRRFMAKSSMAPSMAEDMSMEAGGAPEPPPVVIEAMFDVGEYEIVVLSSTESNALEDWLIANKYNIPTGAAKVLAPYIAQGQYFFVARVNASKVKFDASGNAVLSPLRFNYDSADFSLPVRLGLLNADGPQDLLIHTISRQGRFEVANYPNTTVPTNLFVDKKVMGQFGGFYDQLFDAARKNNENAVVTEYAWGGVNPPNMTNPPQPPVKCDPCVEPPQMARNAWESELWALGADIVGDFKSKNYPMARVEVEAAVDSVKTYPVPIPGEKKDPASTEPVEPGSFTYDAALIKGVLEENRASLESCYKAVQQGNSQRLPAVVDVPVSISKAGWIDHQAMQNLPAYQNNQNAQIGMAILQCALNRGVQFTAPDVASVRADIQMSFDARYYDRDWFEINRWTLTRLHARYTADELDEDLVFRAAKPIKGGRGTPQGVKPTLPTGPEAAPVNNFQARYIVLHYFDKWHMCVNPKRGIWTGSRPNTAPTRMNDVATGAEVEKIKLSSVIKSELPWSKKKKRRKR